MLNVEEVRDRILAEMAGKTETNLKIWQISQKISQGKKVKYADALEFARETGKIMRESMRKHLPDVLTNGMLFRSEADQVLRKPMEVGGKQVAETAAEIQKQLNEEAGIHIRAIEPELNEDQINGIITNICNADSFEAGKENLFSQIENYLEGVVDDCAKENADFHYEAGLSPRIVRQAFGKCCEWCSNLAGTYEYAKVRNKGNDVFRRHKNCHCIVNYDPGDGAKRWQNVHTREWTDANDDELRERQLHFGERQDFEHDYSRIKAREIKNYKANNLFIDQKVNLSPRDVRRINKQISQAKELLEIPDTCKSPFVIVKDDSILAAYNPRTDTFFVSSRMADEAQIVKLQQGYACPNDPRSTMVHELFHWKDAEEYRQTVGTITDASEKSGYSVYQRERSRKELMNAGVDLDNGKAAREISMYAEEKYLDNNFEELYTEFRTKRKLERGHE